MCEIFSLQLKTEQRTQQTHTHVLVVVCVCVAQHRRKIKMFTFFTRIFNSLRHTSMAITGWLELGA